MFLSSARTRLLDSPGVSSHTRRSRLPAAGRLCDKPSSFPPLGALPSKMPSETEFRAHSWPKRCRYACREGRRSESPTPHCGLSRWHRRVRADWERGIVNYFLVRDLCGISSRSPAASRGKIAGDGSSHKIGASDNPLYPGTHPFRPSQASSYRMETYGTNCTRSCVPLRYGRILSISRELPLGAASA